MAHEAHVDMPGNVARPEPPPVNETQRPQPGHSNSRIRGKPQVTEPVRPHLRDSTCAPLGTPDAPRGSTAPGAEAGEGHTVSPGRRKMSGFLAAAALLLPLRATSKRHPVLLLSNVSVSFQLWLLYGQRCNRSVTNSWPPSPRQQATETLAGDVWSRGRVFTAGPSHPQPAVTLRPALPLCRMFTFRPEDTP